jgi:membrane protein implicated in regulation of membrane protease activity
MSLWPVWLIGALLLLAVEAHTQALYAVFIAAAFFAAAIADGLGAALWVQGVVVAVVGLGGIAGIRRPVARRFQRTHGVLAIPGVYGGFVGQKALVLDEVGDEHHPGHAQLAGQSYLAITEGAPLAANTEVIVAAVRGTTLIVRRHR